MTTKLPHLDGERFVARLEQGVADGDADHIEAHRGAMDRIAGTP